MTETLYLGLIGDNILRSRSPLLHRLAGVQNGIEVTYDRLIPKELGQDFDTVFASAAARGFRGVNVTYPYKERVARMVTIDDPLVRAIGAVNTVLFEADGPKGCNTDYSGFVAAYRHARPDIAPGIACLIGTGGVGRALAFGLVTLGASNSAGRPGSGQGRGPCRRSARPAWRPTDHRGSGRRPGSTWRGRASERHPGRHGRP